MAGILAGLFGGNKTIWWKIMNVVIYKYECKETVCLPQGSIILDCQVQNGVPVFWAIVNSMRDKTRKITFKVIGTGNEFDSNDLRNYSHFKTIQDNAGFVWHIFANEPGVKE